MSNPGPSTQSSVNLQPVVGSFDNSGNLLTLYGPNLVPLVFNGSASGATINNTPIGATTPSTGSFTAVSRTMIAAITANTYTVLASDTHLMFNNASQTCTVTLPAAASFPGRELSLRNLAAFTVVSATSNVVPAAGGAAGTAIIAATAGKWVYLVSDGTAWQIQMSN